VRSLYLRTVDVTCVKSLRSSYMGKYLQTTGPRGPTVPCSTSGGLLGPPKACEGMRHVRLATAAPFICGWLALASYRPREREIFMEKLRVRLRLIIVMIFSESALHHGSLNSQHSLLACVRAGEVYPVPQHEAGARALLGRRRTECRGVPVGLRRRVRPTSNPQP